jgi:hypothetical protein
MSEQENGKYNIINAAHTLNGLDWIPTWNETAP